MHHLNGILKKIKERKKLIAINLKKKKKQVRNAILKPT